MEPISVVLSPSPIEPNAPTGQATLTNNTNADVFIAVRVSAVKHGPVTISDELQGEFSLASGESVVFYTTHDGIPLVSISSITVVPIHLSAYNAYP